MEEGDLPPVVGRPELAAKPGQLQLSSITVSTAKNSTLRLASAPAARVKL